jgi:hypothetical protein
MCQIVKIRKYNIKGARIVEYAQRRAKKGDGRRMVDLESGFDDSRIGTDRTGLATRLNAWIQFVRCMNGID